MNYQVHYDRLIERARHRTLDGYRERHHVVPKCMGGTDANENIVDLTAEEHFVAHQLLVKLHPGHRGLTWALSAMTQGTGKHQRSNKRYAWLRKRFAEMITATQKGRKHTDEARAKMSASGGGWKGVPKSAEQKAKMSAAAKGRKKSPEHVAAMSKARSGVKRGPLSDDARLKHAETMRRNAKTRDNSCRKNPEYRAKQSETMKRIWAERRTDKEGVQ